MNFNLKKYLVLSIAGLAVCGMQSKSNAASLYRNRLPNKFTSYNDSTAIPSKITVTNRTESVVNIEKIEPIADSNSIVDLIASYLDNDNDNSNALAVLRMIKSSANDLGSLVEDIAVRIKTIANNLSQQSSVQNARSNMYYSVPESLMKSAFNILALLEFVGELQEHNKSINGNLANKTPQFKFRQLRENTLLDQLWNMIIKIGDCKRLYEHISKDFVSNINNNINDSGLAELLCVIYNNAKHVSSQASDAFIRNFSDCFNISEPFTKTQNGKLRSSVYSIDNNRSPRGLVNQDLDYKKVVEVLDRIGFNGALTDSQINTIDLIFQLIDTTKLPKLGESQFDIINFDDLVNWIRQQVTSEGNVDEENDVSNPNITKTNTNTGLLRNQNQQPKPLNNDNNQLHLLRNNTNQNTEEPVVESQSTFNPITPGTNNTNKPTVQSSNVNPKAPITPTQTQDILNPESTEPTYEPVIDKKKDNNKNEYLKITGLEGKFGAGVKIKSIKAYKEAPAGAAVVYHANSMKKDLSEIRPVNQSCQVVFKFNDGRFARDYLETPIIKNGIGVVRGNHEILNNKLLMDEVNKVANWHQGNFLVFDLVKE